MNLPTAPQHWLGPVLIGVTCCILLIFFPHAEHSLAFYRDGISNGQYWRLITANLLHTNTNHLLMNLAGLALLWLLHGEHYRLKHYLTIWLLCAIGCTAGLYLFTPHLQWYVGLSGVLHGLVVYGACLDIRQRATGGTLLLAGVAIKIGYEQIFGANAETISLIDAPVAVNAHLFGALTGLILALISLVLTGFVMNNNSSNKQ